MTEISQIPFTLVTGDMPASVALLSSPAFTDTPTAPTAAPGTNTTQLATTEFVAASFASSTFTQLGTGAVALPLTTLLETFTNFAEWAPDRTGATDCSALLQDACNSANAHTGVLYIPVGTYTVGSLITITGAGSSRLLIICEGPATFLYNGTNGCFAFVGTTNYLQYPGIVGGYFQPTSSGSGWAISFTDCYHPYLIRPIFSANGLGFLTNGIKFLRCWPGEVFEPYLDTGLIGIQWTDTCNQIRITGGEIDRFTTAGITGVLASSGSGNSNQIIGVYLEQNSNSINLMNPGEDSFTIRDCYINQDNLLTGSSYAIHTTGNHGNIDGNKILNSNVLTGIHNDGIANNIVNNVGIDLTGADYFIRNHTTAYGAYVDGNKLTGSTIGTYGNASNAPASNLSSGNNLTVSGSGSGTTISRW
jgi:hypothetical protein